MIEKCTGRFPVLHTGVCAWLDTFSMCSLPIPRKSSSTWVISWWAIVSFRLAHGFAIFVALKNTLLPLLIVHTGLFCCDAMLCYAYIIPFSCLITHINPLYYNCCSSLKRSMHLGCDFARFTCSTTIVPVCILFSVLFAIIGVVTLYYTNQSWDWLCSRSQTACRPFLTMHYRSNVLSSNIYTSK